MASGHPLDSTGRVLPHPWWPADRQADGELEFVRRFCNSTNRENGAERFDTGASLDAWLIAEGSRPVAASPRQLARLIGLREALSRLVIANTAGKPDRAAWQTMHGIVGDVSFGIEAGDAGAGVVIAARGTPVDMLVGRVALAIAAAQRDGTWSRLKACQHCRWVVFDASKNRSARWCSMSACGGRHNARQYRQRNTVKQSRR